MYTDFAKKFTNTKQMEEYVISIKTKVIKMMELRDTDLIKAIESNDVNDIITMCYMLITAMREIRDENKRT